MTDLTELNKLEQYLIDNNIYYRREDYEGSSDWHQIIVYDQNNRLSWDAVCHRGSYGYNRGLLEVCGNIVKTSRDGTAGFLTADQVITMITNK